MTQEHPITPPPELVQQWWHEAALRKYNGADADKHVTSMAAQWGADQELEACCELLNDFNTYHLVELLRAARIRKPPSLKEQALKALDHILNNSSTDLGGNTIRRALEQLPDHE
jgi:hypothetical protein